MSITPLPANCSGFCVLWKSYSWVLTPHHSVLSTIKVMHDLFCRTAAPDVWSNGGPQFTSCKFKAFWRDWEVSHYLSSPLYPQSNGKAESTMKQLIKAAWRHHSVDHDILSQSLLHTMQERWQVTSSAYGHPVQDSFPAH